MKNFIADIRGKTNEGFTLVELMVVVAIIGIVSAVAIPNFKRYQAKAKTSEAKLQLSAIYSAEVSLESDYDSYATCLTYAGYIAPVSGNYYAVGFSSDNSAARGYVSSNGGSGCAASQFNFPAHKKVGAKTAATVTAGGITTAIVSTTGDTFIAGAAGYVDSTPVHLTTSGNSQWTIDENKTLVQLQKGY